MSVISQVSPRCITTCLRQSKSEYFTIYVWRLGRRAVNGCGTVGLKVERLCEGGDNLLTVREAGQRAKVPQLFLGCWLCESALNAELMTHCQNLNLCWISDPSVHLNIVAHVHMRPCAFAEACMETCIQCDAEVCIFLFKLKEVLVYWYWKEDISKRICRIIGNGLFFMKESCSVHLSLVSLLFPVFRYQPWEWLLTVQAV